VFYCRVERTDRLFHYVKDMTIGWQHLQLYLGWVVFRKVIREEQKFSMKRPREIWTEVKQEGLLPLSSPRPSPLVFSFDLGSAFPWPYLSLANNTLQKNTPNRLLRGLALYWLLD